MATVRIPAEGRTITDQGEVTRYLRTLGIDYERWPGEQRVADDAPPEAVLAAYAPEIAQLKARGGYVTADVIDVTSATPGLDAMLAKFNIEHWHDEDEVRFIVRGRGLFHIHAPSPNGPVIAIEVETGDLLRVPRGTHHWFDLCGDRNIRAIRLFQDKSGWTPHYTNSGVDKGYEPVCMGPAYFPMGAARAEPRN
jgi:1,2-dihydroxy-3-keto-5-methylthiopentene dioxygenase